MNFIKTPSSRTLALALVTPTAFALTLAGCGGGGSSDSTPIEGLTVGSSMSVLTVPSGGGSLAANIAPGVIADTSTFPETCDYNTDTQRFHVYDPSMGPIETVNGILCMLVQTGYPYLVNAGLYKAQVDQETCNMGSDGPSSDDQSSGQSEDFSIWTVRVERTSSTAPQEIDFWVPNNGDGPDSDIWVHMTIYEGVSESNPFGVFDLNFAQIPEGGTISDAGMIGSLQTLDVLEGFIGFSFFEQKGDPSVAQDPGQHAEIVQANVNMFADQSQGVAHILSQRRENFGVDSGLMETEYAIAFDDANVLRGKDGDSGTCLSRTDYESHVWRYNLYHASGDNAGQQVDLNGGFGFQTEAGAYGWASYYGIFTPPGSSLESGATVTRQTFGSDTPETFTVFKAPGKLIRNARNTLALASLSVSDVFTWWDFGTPGMPPVGPPAQFQVVYADLAWTKITQWDSKGMVWTPLEVPETIDTSEYGFLGLYSEGLGGQVSFVHGNEFLTYWAQEFVDASSTLFSGSTAIDFYGYSQCLDHDVTGSEAESGDVYVPDSTDVGAPIHYRFYQDDLTLYYVDEFDVEWAAGLGIGEAPAFGPFTWGMRSGPMVTDTTAFESVYEIWGSDVFYTYETGANPWNQYSTLLDDAGDPVAFDQPIQFAYTHSTENDRNGDTSNDGRTFFLTYDGAGNLHGLPMVGVDFDSDGFEDRWYPACSLADAVLMGPTGEEYVVKAIDGEQTLSDATGQCGALNIDTVWDLALPTADGYVAPDIGPRPTVDEAPRVIEGEVLEPTTSGG